MAQVTFIDNTNPEGNLADAPKRTQENRENSRRIVVGDISITQLINRLIREAGQNLATQKRLVKYLLKLGISSNSSINIYSPNSSSTKNMLLNTQHKVIWATGQTNCYIEVPLCSGNGIEIEFVRSESNLEDELDRSVAQFYRDYVSHMIGRYTDTQNILRKRNLIKRHSSRKLLSDMFNGGESTDGIVLQNYNPLYETLKWFLEENLNPTTTARKMKLHRNTVLYRIGQIKSKTGLDPMNFVDAVILSEQIDAGEC